jgi:aquaporin Z
VNIVGKAPSRYHWKEYAIEAWALGTFMLSACIFGTLLEHPASPVRAALADDTTRRVLMGIAIGLTAISIIYSPWGRRSGAHLNPAFTVTFFRLGRVAPRDALLYPVAQFTGGIAGVLLAALLLRSAVADPAVHHVTTLPGQAGVAAAFGAEILISLFLMTMVLVTASHARLARFTGVFAGILVATYIAFEAPISGMSMNPARTLGSAFVARDWTALWIYFTAPLIGMLSASQLYLALRGPSRVPCAKMRHADGEPCIFCEYAGHSPAQR